MGKLKENIKNMKVKKKMSFLAFVLMIGVIIVGLMAIISLWIFNKEVKNITDKWMPSVILAEELNTLTSDYRILQYNYLTSDEEASLTNLEQQLLDLKSKIQSKSSEYEARTNNNEEKEMLLQAREIWENYLTGSNKIIELKKQQKIEEASKLMLADLKTYYDLFIDKFEGLVEYNKNGSDEAAEKCQKTFIFVVIIVVLVIAFILLLANVLSKEITSIIVTPLNEVQSALGGLVNGNFDVSMNYQANDEIGVLVKEVNLFIDSLTHIIKDEQYLLGEMARGNFDIKSRETKRYIGGFEAVLLSIRGINTELGNTLSDISVSAEQVNTASEQMAEEAQSLASGAAEQADTIEQLLSTIEETAKKANISAEQSKLASTGADEVMKYAENSNQCMEQMVAAMDKLNQTSTEISSIINAIEDIASQTNLLSLNASIEAARAGEAGKGFAVVADEIGKLALQCSQAANNTKLLIESSIQQAKNGDSMAKETAQALHAVTIGINKVVQLAEEVNKNCEKQSLSMLDLNKGVHVISKVVECNSAAAEESSATSEELSAHADNLNTMLSRFQFKKRGK